MPPYPLCVLGLHPDKAKKVHEHLGTDTWRGEEFQLGRAPSDSKYCAVWHALFESFAPAERPLSPVLRLLLRSRGARLRGETAPDFQAGCKLALDSVSLTTDSGAPPAELERVLHAYVEDIPTHVVETITSRGELVGEKGQLHPYGVVAGMVSPWPLAHRTVPV